MWLRKPSTSSKTPPPIIAKAIFEFIRQTNGFIRDNIRAWAATRRDDAPFGLDGITEGNLARVVAANYPKPATKSDVSLLLK